MSVRHLNYTGRKKITRSSVRIAVDGIAPSARLAASFDLGEYAFPDTARVVVEAQAGWTIQRFEFGTVAEYRAPANSELTEFDSMAGVLFRLKVIATGDEEGRLLGVADKLRPSESMEEASQRSFVVVRPEDLGECAWKVDFDEHQPLLLINRRLGDHHDFIRRRVVAALMFPEVLRRILEQAVELGLDEEDPGHWAGKAIQLGEQLAAGVVPPADDDEAVGRWIDEAVGAFARRHQLLEAVASWLEGGD